MPSSPQPPQEGICECGHSAATHWLGLGQPGTCFAQIDKRRPEVGGDDLWPCPCKGFVPKAWEETG